MRALGYGAAHVRVSGEASAIAGICASTLEVEPPLRVVHPASVDMLSEQFCCRDDLFNVGGTFPVRGPADEHSRYVIPRDWQKFLAVLADQGDRPSLQGRSEVREQFKGALGRADNVRRSDE
jgi:hypothetical protein